MKNIKNIFISILLIATTGLLSGYFTHIGINGWYNKAQHSFLTPPNSYFRPVWIFLYLTLIYIFSQILSNKNHFAYKQSVILFTGGLVLQILWCYTYFALGYLGFGLTILIGINFINWFLYKNLKKISKNYAYLLLPYAFWILFATILNISFIYIHGFDINFCHILILSSHSGNKEAVCSCFMGQQGDISFFCCFSSRFCAIKYNNSCTN